jgi:sugar-specific transcriptional regulator TrmB
MNDLENLGLSEKEVKVYISLLELGNAKVTNISQRAGINRTTGYDILNSLANKGLINALGKGNRQEFTAESPVAIANYIKRQQYKLEEDLIKVQDIVPSLLAIQSKGSKPSVKFYEGEEGLMKVYEDTLTSRDGILGFANADEMHQGLPNYFPRYYKRRAAKKIWAKAIVQDSELGKLRKNEDANELREIRLVPHEDFNFTPEINIYNNKIMIASWREKLGIIIESKEIADAFKKIHALSWLGTERFNDDKK